MILITHDLDFRQVQTAIAAQQSKDKRRDEQPEERWS